MFAKSKIVAPLVALLVACMAVEAAPVADGFVPEVCSCGVWTDLQGPIKNRNQDVCTSVGQANGAVWDVPNNHCDISTQSGHDSFFVDCSQYSNIDSAGVVHYGEAGCLTGYQHVPTPLSCSCTDPSGVNTTAQTQRVCTLVGNVGTVVGDKCVVASDDQLYTFGQLCTIVYPGSTKTCSA